MSKIRGYAVLNLLKMPHLESAKIGKTYYAGAKPNGEEIYFNVYEDPVELLRECPIGDVDTKGPIVKVEAERSVSEFQVRFDPYEYSSITIGEFLSYMDLFRDAIASVEKTPSHQDGNFIVSNQTEHFVLITNSDNQSLAGIRNAIPRNGDGQRTLPMDIDTDGPIPMPVTRGVSNTLISTGKEGTLMSAGDHDVLVALGEGVVAVSSGCGAELVGTGHMSGLDAIGPESNIASAGHTVFLSANGSNASLAAAGEFNSLTSHGYGNTLAVSGKNGSLVAWGNNSVIAASGPGCQAKGAVGTWISLAEYDDDDECIGFVTGCIGKGGLMEDVWYGAKGGRFIEVEARS